MNSTVQDIEEVKNMYTCHHKEKNNQRRFYDRIQLLKRTLIYNGWCYPSDFNIVTTY